MRLALIALTSTGRDLAEKLAAELDNCVFLQNKKSSVAGLLTENWLDFDAFICIMASGIVVRSIAPLIKDKYTDPCVLVLDPLGRHIISLLSGHLGGGNQLAHTIAGLTGGSAVITTGSDSLGLAPLDLWFRHQNIYCNSRADLTRLSAKLVNEGTLTLFSDCIVTSLPPGLILVESVEAADLVISYKPCTDKRVIQVFPRCLVVGTGCNRNTPKAEFDQAFTELLHDNGLCPESVSRLASIDLKNDEVGLLDFARSKELEIDFYNKEELNSFTNLEISHAALKAVGAIGVAEPAALLAGRSDTLICRKRKWKNITMAVALAPFTLSEQVQDASST